MRIREERGDLFITNTVSEFFEHPSDFHRPLEAKYIITHEVSIMEKVPIVLISRYEINVLYEDMFCMSGEEFQKLWLSFSVDMMKYIDKHGSIISLESLKSFFHKITGKEWELGEVFTLHDVGQFLDSFFIEIQSANLRFHPKKCRIEGRYPVSASYIEYAARLLEEGVYLPEKWEWEYKHSHTEICFGSETFISEKWEQEECISNFLHHGNIGKKDKGEQKLREEESGSCSY